MKPLRLPARWVQMVCLLRNAKPDVPDPDIQRFRAKRRENSKVMKARGRRRTA